MTVRDAKNLLILDGYKVAKVRQGIYQVSKDWFTETINGEQVPKYCHVTTFKSSFNNSTRLHIVYARPRKTKESAYSFQVYDIYAEEIEK